MSSAPRVCLPLPATDAALAYAPEQLRRWEIQTVELAQADLAGLTEAARAELQAALQRAGVTVAAIRASVDGAPAEAFALARTWSAEYVVAPAPAGEDADAWISRAAGLAEAGAVPLLVENRPASRGDTGRNFADLLRRAPAAWIGAAFDPVGFAALREHAFLTVWTPGALKTRLRLLRVADATFETGAPVRLNQGNAEVKELISAVLARGFDGIFALCPLGPAAAEVEIAVADFHALLAELGAREAVPPVALSADQLGPSNTSTAAPIGAASAPLDPKGERP